MLLLTGKTVRQWWSELSMAPSGQKTKQSEVAAAFWTDAQKVSHYQAAGSR